MRIALLYVHHRRVVGQWFRRACQQLGHTVHTFGPWREDELFGIHGCDPDVQFPWRQPFRYPEHYALREYDLRILFDHGDDFRVDNLSAPWAHVAWEGPFLRWSDTPYKYTGIPCQSDEPSAQWLQSGFDAEMHRYRDGYREYDFMHLCSLHPWRVALAERLRIEAPDLHCVTTNLWGPLYVEAYCHALTTVIGQRVDFISMRTFEAMATGCLVLSPMNPAMCALFEPGVDFISYEPEYEVEGNPTPPFDWLVDTVRRVRRDGDSGMGARAAAKVHTAHSYQHRVQRILRDVRE